MSISNEYLIEIEALKKENSSLKEIINSLNPTALQQEILEAKNRAESSEEKLKLMIKNSIDSFVLLNEKGEQFYISDVAVRETGYSIEELMGPIQNIAHPDDVAKILEIFSEAVIHPEKIYRLQYRHKHKNGGYIWFEAVGQSFLDNPLINAIIVNSRNITTIKENEAELIKAKESAEKSDRLKSAFLANMSHEIRTPMNGILGFTTLLKNRALNQETQQEYVNIIEKSGNRMLNIINDIIDISKIESDLMEVYISESNINEQLDYIYMFFNPEVDSKGIEFQYHSGLDTEKAYIETDREKIFAILTNLIKNAIKYTHEGKIEFGYVKKGGFLEFYIKDSGIGIAKEEQVSIFERFNQAEIENRPLYQGAGLGLSIAKAYIKMLKGDIWVESTLGVGSTFYFTIPYTPKAEAIKENKKYSFSSIENTQEANLKILIADDDFVSQQILSLLLQDLSKDIHIVSNGIEAVDLHQRHGDFDLILMDSQMPKMNGIDAVKEIRKVDQNVVIIAQSAYAYKNEMDKVKAAGCNDSISKPVRKEELHSIIHKNMIKINSIK